MALYTVIVSDPFGVRLGDASSFIRLEYTRTVNDIGSLSLTLPSNFNTSLLRIPDGRIEVWRRLDSGREYLDTEVTWLIKNVTYKLDANGLTTIVVGADTPNCILRSPGRFVNYGSAAAASILASAPADSLITTLATYNIGSQATSGVFNTNAARNVSAYVNIAPSPAQGYTMTYDSAWRDVLKCMQEIAQASTTNNVYLAFDIMAPTADTLEFRTYTQQRGIDHRFPNGYNPVILSPDMGNLGEVELTVDYRNEVTYAQANAASATTAPDAKSAIDTARVSASPFGMREQFVSANSTAVQNTADAALRAGRPRIIFKGRILDTLDTQYGVHWSWGDYVTATAFGQTFDCRIEAVHVTVENNNEVVDAWLRNDTL